MARPVFVAAVALTAALALAACGGDGEDRPNVDVIGGGTEGAGSASASGEVTGPGASLYEPSTDQALNLATSTDLRDLRAAMAPAAQGMAVDWAAARAIYEQGKNQLLPNGARRSLASLSTAEVLAVFPQADAVYGPGNFLDRMIRGGLEGTGRGTGLSDNARRQFVDKGIQVLLYGRALAALERAEERVGSDGPGAAAAVDEAWATIAGEPDSSTNRNNGLLATAVAREEEFGFQGKIARPLEASLFAAKTAAEQRNPTVFGKALADVRGYLNTIFYLSTLRYAAVLEGDARASDREVHLAEGWTYFQAIRASVAGASPMAASRIEAAFTRSVADTVSRELTDDVYAALNEASVVDEIRIPAELRVKEPRR